MNCLGPCLKHCYNHKYSILLIILLLINIGFLYYLINKKDKCLNSKNIKII